MLTTEPARGRCWRCDVAIDADDRYCRQCGEGQGAYLAWYYRPLGIVVLALTALGPFVLPLVWRSPRLDRNGKWIASAGVIGFTVYLVWTLERALEEVGKVLGGM